MANVIDFDIGLPDSGATVDVSGLPRMQVFDISDYGGVKNVAPTTGFGVGGVMTGIASVIPALTSLLGVSAKVADIEAKNEAILRNMESAEDSYIFSVATREQQLKDLEAVAADKMTASGLEQLKLEASIKAGSAETGAKSKDALVQANMNKLHTDSAIMRSYEVQKGGVMSAMVAERLGFENQLESMASGMSTPLNVGLQTFGSGMQGFNLGLMLLSQNQQEAVYGTNTTGV